MKLDAPGSRCLLEWMTRDHAPYDAMAFTRSIGARGYLRNFRQEGPIGVAYVAFPGSKTDRHRVLLVNGKPFRFDPDDPHLPIPERLEQNERYQILVRQHGPLALVPGDRFNEQMPLAVPGDKDEQRFLFSYHLSPVGTEKIIPEPVLVWVRFDASGTFTGRELESMPDVKSCLTGSSGK